MRKLNVKKIEIDALGIAMVSDNAATIKDLRNIDRVCNVLESVDLKDKEATVDLEFEDADFNYMKSKFDRFNQWNPSARKMIIGLYDKIEEASKND